MIDDFISRTFAARDAAHREHFRTKSYAAHMALGAFYETLPGLVDEFVEVYQGQFGLAGDFEVSVPLGGPSMLELLRDDVDWMQATREDVCQEDTSLLNLMDGIVALYLRTIYKLEHLT